MIVNGGTGSKVAHASRRRRRGLSPGGGVPIRDAMEVQAQAQAALSILSMTVQGAHDALQRAQTHTPPASAPASAHADVILELSSAAQSLVSAS
jgi:hypothetical protein